MSTPDWRLQGFLTPDAPGCQREVWALCALLRQRLAELLESLAQATAEPTWQATLKEHARAAWALARVLADEAGDDARAVVAEDDLVRELDLSLGEIVSSGHAPSQLATGYAVLGELALAPIALLDELAGTYAAGFTRRLLDADQHRILGRLFAMLEADPGTRQGVQRLLRHLHQQLATVHLGWRQTFHVLGVDGERVTEASRGAAAAALGALGLSAGPRELAVFKDA